MDTLSGDNESATVNLPAPSNAGAQVYLQYVYVRTIPGVSNGEVVGCDLIAYSVNHHEVDITALPPPTYLVIENATSFTFEAYAVNDSENDEGQGWVTALMNVFIDS
jgi:hypothetical protein